MLSWSSGGTGIRAALKMLCPRGHVGSSPTWTTGNFLRSFLNLCNKGSPGHPTGRPGFIPGRVPPGPHK